MKIFKTKIEINLAKSILDISKDSESWDFNFFKKEESIYIFIDNIPHNISIMYFMFVHDTKSMSLKNFKECYKNLILKLINKEILFMEGKISKDNLKEFKNNLIK